jgi:hypothetical protein
MAPRGWSFVGGLMIVTTITYLNMTQITSVAHAMRETLIVERKRLDAARARSRTASGDTSTVPSAQTPPSIWPSPSRVADRVKKMWNEDIDKSVRRMQNTDWERMGRQAAEQLGRARERMASALENRFQGDSTKKSA